MFRFRIDERNMEQGGVIEVPFRASGFNARSGYQMTIRFDPAMLALDGIVPGSWPDMNTSNFGTQQAEAGLVTTLWVVPEPMTIADGEVLFTLKFKVLGKGARLSEVLQPGSDITRAEGYDSHGNALNLDFVFNTGQSDADDFALYQNHPNPFQSRTTISFRLPEAGTATVRIFNTSGQLVKTLTGDFEKGYHQIPFPSDEFGPAGVYYYELESGNHSARKELVRMD